MKLFTTLLLAALVGALVYAVRRRLKLALVVGGVAYLLLLPIRLIFSAGDLADRAESLALPVAGVLVVWLVLWRVSVAYERRKKRRAALSRPGPRDR